MDKKLLNNLVKKASKTRAIKSMLKEFKEHFETNKWPLSYDVYKAESDLFEPIFNKVIEKAGYKIKYVSSRGRIFILK